MIIRRLENIELEKRTSLRVGSSGFISLNPLKTFFLSSSVSEVLMVKNQDNSSYSLSTHLLSDRTHVLSHSSGVLSDSSEVLTDTTHVLSHSTRVLTDTTDVLSDSSGVLLDSSNVLTDSSDVLCDLTGILSDSTDVLSDSSDVLTDSTEELDDSTEQSSNSSEDLINSTFSGDFIEYKYNAAGQKISKFVSSVNTNNTVKLVEYLDGFQYTGEELNFFPHAEGWQRIKHVDLPLS